MDSKDHAAGRCGHGRGAPPSGAACQAPGSLGRLEDLSVQLAGITGRVHNKIEKKHLLIFAADNGVVDEGVSSAPRSVTLLADDQPYARQDRRGDALQAFRLRDHRLRRRRRSEHPRKGGAMPQDRLRHEEYRPRQRHDARGVRARGAHRHRACRGNRRGRARRRRDGHRQHNNVLRRARSAAGRACGDRDGARRRRNG